MSARFLPDPVAAAMTQGAMLRTRPARTGARQRDDATVEQASIAPASAAGAAATQNGHIAFGQNTPGTRAEASHDVSFAAAVAASSLPTVPQSPQELLLRQGQVWTPPESALRLKDRTV